MVQLRQRVRDISPHDVAAELESFLTSDINLPWPLQPSDAIELMKHPPPFRGGTHKEKCLDCMTTIAEINEAWDAGVDECLHQWPDYRSPETSGVGEDEIVNFYTQNGFDRWGFEEKGYNDLGQHYLDIPAEWRRAKDPMSRYTAQRMVCERVCNQIARYSR